MGDIYDIHEGMSVFVVPGEYADTDNDDEHALDRRVHGRAYEYHGNGEWRVLCDEIGHDESIIVPERSLIPDTPEYRLGELVFGEAGKTISIPDPERRVKPPELREGRCFTDVESALLSLILAPHTRAVLKIVDPQGLKQADAAIWRKGWWEGSEWPEDTLTTRESGLHGIGKRLFEVGKHLSRWQGVSNDPTEHPLYAEMRRAGIDDGTIKEFARIASERCGENRLALICVGRDLGFSESEMFQAEEVAAEGV